MGFASWVWGENFCLSDVTDERKSACEWQAYPVAEVLFGDFLGYENEGLGCLVPIVFDGFF
jgi:hypothetical protein